MVWEHLLKARQHVMISGIIGDNIFTNGADSIELLLHLSRNDGVISRIIYIFIVDHW